MAWRRKKGSASRFSGRPQKKRGEMNSTERWYYENHLLPKVASGEVERIEYEAIRFELGKGSTYLPDFYVFFTDGHAELHETKGFWREDDRVKIKVAATRYSEFRWIGITISGKKIKKLEEFNA